MATTLSRPAARAASASPARRPRRQSWLRRHVVQIFAAVALLYMFLPVAYVIAFSFNNPSDRYNSTWNSFTFSNWTDVCGPAGVCDSLKLSLEIGALATLGATVLGTLIAFALARRRFGGRATTNLLIFLPMATPEVVMGSSLLTLFVNLQVPLGFWTIVIAHITFDISFVVVTVKARLQGLDSRLEQAAMDLYANEWQTFRRITFPLVFPGILGAALLAFSLSFDDFIITNFNSGQTVTFPMFVWGASLRSIPPQVNVVGSIMFVASLGLALVGQVFYRRRRA
jgi:spermidine/putrescine transport system permease protein